MSESEHNPARTKRSPGKMGLPQEGFVFNGNAELQESYLREVGQFHLLTAEDEKAWAEQAEESRREIRQILIEFPQVLLQQLRLLLDSCESGRLPGGMIAGDGEDLTVQSVKEMIEQLLDWSEERGDLFQNGQDMSPTAEAAKSEFAKRILALGLRDRFFDDCTARILRNPEDFANQALKRLEEADRKGRLAKNVLVEANLRLVISIAKHYSGGLLPFPDLVQEGNIGLMRAVETFRSGLGHRLSTYSTYWIRQAISRAVAMQGRSIRMPVNTLRQLSKIRQCERELLLETGRVPEPHEIAEKLEMSAARVSALLKMSQQPISLQSIRDGDREWGDTISDEKCSDAREQLAFESLKETVRDALDTLEPKEREVIIRRFGLNDHPCETLEQIGRHLNLTSERIRQIENMALRKLRDPEKNKYFAGFQ